MIKYVFNDGPITIRAADKAKPQVIGEALAKIAATAGGKLTPSAVVEAARPEKHPLHKHFEWDDTKAAHLYRLQEARALIRVVRIKDEERDENPPAFLSITEKGGKAYRSLGDVQQSRDLQLLVLKQAERDLGAFQQRYRELTDICDMVKPAHEAVRRRRAEREGAPVQ